MASNTPNAQVRYNFTDELGGKHSEVGFVFRSVFDSLPITTVAFNSDGSVTVHAAGKLKTGFDAEAVVHASGSGMNGQMDFTLTAGGKTVNFADGTSECIINAR